MRHASRHTRMSLSTFTILAAHPIVHVNASLNATATILLLDWLLAHQARPRRSAQAHDDVRVRRVGRVSWRATCGITITWSTSNSHTRASFATCTMAILATHVPLAMHGPAARDLADLSRLSRTRLLSAVWSPGRAAHGRGRLSQEAHPARPLDLSDLAIRIGHGCHCLRHALSSLAARREIS